MRKIENILFFLTLLIAFTLSWVTLQHQVTFGYDQSRDAFEALNIASGDIKIIGPATDIPGVFHGVLYYYFLAALYALFQGDPQLVATFYFFLFYLTLPACWYLASMLFKRKDVAVIATVLYAFSPLFIAFTKWLSNPGLAVLTLPFLLIVIWKYILKPGKLYAGLIGALYGLLIQSDLAFGLLLVLLPIYKFVFKVKTSFVEIIIFIGGLLAITLSYFLAELKFQGRGTQAILSFLTDNHKAATSFDERIAHMGGRVTDLFSLSFTQVPTYIAFGLIILSLAGLWYKRKKLQNKPLLFLLIWVANIFLFAFFNSGVSHSAFAFAPTLLAFLILSAYILVVFLPKMFLIPFVLLLIFFQTQTTTDWYAKNFTPLSIQIGDTVSEAKKVVNYTYAAAGDKPFAIKTITVPLSVNTTWAYMYNLEKDTRPFLPYWDGPDQAGYQGAHVLPMLPKDHDITTVFLIIEPQQGMPDYIVKQVRKEEDIFSTVVETKNIGTYVVEKRQVKVQ